MVAVNGCVRFEVLWLGKGECTMVLRVDASRPLTVLVGVIVVVIVIGARGAELLEVVVLNVLVLLAGKSLNPPLHLPAVCTVTPLSSSSKHTSHRLRASATLCYER